jgi:ketosteroid isomerase-like protein
MAAAETPVLDAVRSADDERVAATVAADRARLGAILSDDLSYCHSTGKRDTKASYADAIVSGRSRYIKITYERRDFREAAPGIVLMTGRCHIESANGDQKPADNYLGFLAVWRMEGGSWRLLAWQSCHPAPEKG